MGTHSTTIVSSLFVSFLLFLSASSELNDGTFRVSLKKLKLNDNNDLRLNKALKAYNRGGRSKDVIITLKNYMIAM
ncbi:unnamed protein product [Arabis nemorensis]|uniref:Uncharacterized protein n=1 Tax=Arabis nemorensis TaxID=586526 RepID=A0A565ANJ4_9BRAS|nr:unnamed protein product [Arabis nemorensis]